MMTFTEYTSLKHSVLQETMDELARLDNAGDLACKIFDDAYIEMRVNVELMWPDKVADLDALVVQWAEELAMPSFEQLYDDTTAYSSREMMSAPLGYENPVLWMDLEDLIDKIDS